MKALVGEVGEFVLVGVKYKSWLLMYAKRGFSYFSI